MQSRAGSDVNRRMFEKIDALVGELKALATRAQKYGDVALKISFTDGTIRKVTKEVSEIEQ